MEQDGEATSGGIRPRLLSAMQSRIPRTAVAMEEPGKSFPLGSHRATEPLAAVWRTPS